MPYSAPSTVEFKSRFPVFENVSDAAIQSALNEAGFAVSAGWPDDSRGMATMLYAAHILVTDGLGSSSEVQMSGFRRLKIGSLELEAAQSQSIRSASGVDSTSYGRRYLSLLRQVFGPAILVV